MESSLTHTVGVGSLTSAHCVIRFRFSVFGAVACVVEDERGIGALWRTGDNMRNSSGGAVTALWGSNVVEDGRLVV